MEGEVPGWYQLDIISFCEQHTNLSFTGPKPLVPNIYMIDKYYCFSPSVFYLNNH